jgi:hypothetical protein
LTGFGISVKLEDDLEPPLKKLAIGAVRLAAMSQLGPLGGALFLAGGALAGKLLAETEWAKAAADVFTVLATGKAADLLGYAVRGFREERNGDLDRSMHKAAQLALAGLQVEAPPEFADWFRDWDDYLTHTPSEVVFSGTGDADPVALQYDDDEFRALWWSRMEPVLLRWRREENSSFTQLNLSGGDRLPVPLQTLLRARLPEAIQAQHYLVLRDESLRRSWIGFQQHVYRDTLHHLLEVRRQLDRIEAELQQRHATTPPHDMNCSPFRLIEHAQIFGSPRIEAFAPTKEEYTKGLVHRPELTSVVEDRLESIGWALVRGRGASGKTVLATQIALGPQFQAGSVFYLDLARLPSTNGNSGFIVARQPPPRAACDNFGDARP